MGIIAANAVEFGRLLNVLANQIVDANIHFKLYRDLAAAVPDYEVEFNQSSAFWGLTFQAHLDAALARLCRIYDQHNRSLNLQNLLDTIQTNRHIFDMEDFRERMKDNPFVDTLSRKAKKPDAEQLRRDVHYASSGNPHVKKLVKWRNNIQAHRSAHDIVKGDNLSDTYPLSEDEVAELLGSALSILNRYSSLFRASTYSSQSVGHDDYLSVLDWIRVGLETHEREIAVEIAKFERCDSATQ